MSATFDKAAVKALFSEVTSHAQSLGIFTGGVNAHDPDNPPSGPAYAVWLSGIIPAPRASGLAATSGRVEFTGHIMTPRRSRPLDEVEQDVMLLAVDLIAAYSANFTLDDEVMEVDLLGTYGAPLGAEAAFADFQGTPLRVMQVTLPVIIDGLWTQGVAQ